jgi:stress response protein YsnF
MIQQTKERSVKNGPPEDDFARSTIVPVVEEVPVVGKRTVPSGRMRIDKTVSERDVVIDEPLWQRDAHVERVPIGRDVSAGEELPGIRYEGDTMIIPVLHEVPVVVKKIVLKEEIRITRVDREVRQPQTVQVKFEEVSLVHQDEESASTPDQG